MEATADIEAPKWLACAACGNAAPVAMMSEAATLARVAAEPLGVRMRDVLMCVIRVLQSLSRVSTPGV